VDEITDNREAAQTGQFFGSILGAKKDRNLGGKPRIEGISKKVTRADEGIQKEFD